MTAAPMAARPMRYVERRNQSSTLVESAHLRTHRTPPIYPPGLQKAAFLRHGLVSSRRRWLSNFVSGKAASDTLLYGVRRGRNRR